jgi:hypothetical protein
MNIQNPCFPIVSGFDQQFKLPVEGRLFSCIKVNLNAIKVIVPTELHNVPAGQLFFNYGSFYKILNLHIL